MSLRISLTNFLDKQVTLIPSDLQDLIFLMDPYPDTAESLFQK